MASKKNVAPVNTPVTNVKATDVKPVTPIVADESVTVETDTDNGDKKRTNYFKDRVRLFEIEDGSDEKTIEAKKMEAKSLCDTVLHEYVVRDGNGVKKDAKGKPILLNGKPQYYPPIFAVYTVYEKNADGESTPVAFVVSRNEAEATFHYIESKELFTCEKTFGSDRGLTEDNAASKLSKVANKMSEAEKMEFFRKLAAANGVKL